MITLRLYESDDWDKIDPSEPFMVPMDGSAFCNGLGVTAIEDGVVLGSGGIVFVDDETGMAWIRLDKNIGSHVRMARLALEVWNTMLELAGDMKVVAYILNCFERGERLATFLGLQKNCQQVERNGNIYNGYVI